MHKTSIRWYYLLVGLSVAFVFIVSPYIKLVIAQTYVDCGPYPAFISSEPSQSSFSIPGIPCLQSVPETFKLIWQVSQVHDVIFVVALTLIVLGLFVSFVRTVHKPRPFYIWRDFWIGLLALLAVVLALLFLVPEISDPTAFHGIYLMGSPPIDPLLITWP